MKKEIKFVEMKHKDIKILKEKIWKQNNKKCPVLGKEINLDKAVLDHIHKRNDDEYAINKGTIRTTLDFRVNAVLGKLENALKRTGLLNEPDFDIVEFMYNAGDYLKKGAYCETLDNEDIYYIHPIEVTKEPKLRKDCYNRLKKIYDGKAKFPSYPSSGKLTVGLKKLFDKYEIEPIFYS